MKNWYNIAKEVRLAENEEPMLTLEETAYIDKSLGFIVFNWAKFLIDHVLDRARQEKISLVYMNSSETVGGGAKEQKTNYIYENIPKSLGFKSISVNLRERGEERMWLALDNRGNQLGPQSYFNAHLLKIAGRTFQLNDIDKRYQGAFINIVGRKQFYTEDDVQKVLSILEKNKGRKDKNKVEKGFFYDWTSSWSGGQQFNNSIAEIVVKQRIPKEVQEYITSDPVLSKFWMLCLQMKHFDPDLTAFALVSPIDQTTWVINEVQTDAITKYLEIRNQVQRQKQMPAQREQRIDIDTLKDMLQANNRANWIPYIESNHQVRDQLLNNPNMIEQLCDDTEDINEWLQQNAGVVAQGLF